MDMHNCQFCQHANPADAKYCSECGGCLYLVPCPSCGAVNDLKAATCYQCHGKMQPSTTEGLDQAPSVTVITKPNSPDLLSRALDVGKLEPVYPLPPLNESTKSVNKHNVRLAAGTALLAVVAAAGYFGYRHYALINANMPTAAGGTPANAGVIRGEAAVVGAGVAAPAAGKPATNGERGATAAVACVEPAASLGLCASAPAAKKDTEVTAASSTVNARADAAETGKAGKPEAPRQDGCSDASAALGLCAAAPPVPAVTHTQRRE
jgi:hypothetical protein